MSWSLEAHRGGCTLSSDEQSCVLRDAEAAKPCPGRQLLRAEALQRGPPPSCFASVDEVLGCLRAPQHPGSQLWKSWLSVHGRFLPCLPRGSIELQTVTAFGGGVFAKVMKEATRQEQAEASAVLVSSQGKVSGPRHTQRGSPGRPWDREAQKASTVAVVCVPRPWHLAVAIPRENLQARLSCQSSRNQNARGSRTQGGRPPAWQWAPTSLSSFQTPRAEPCVGSCQQHHAWELVLSDLCR